MRTPRFVFLSLLAVAMLSLIVGCGSQENASTGGDANKPHIALVMKSLANEFFKTMEEGARAYHAENQDTFDLTVNGIKNEEDISGQVALVEQMLAKGVDALIIAPADSKALVSVLKRAVKQGVVVVNIDNKLDDDVQAEQGVDIPFVGPNNRKGARTAAEYLASKLQPGDPVALVTGIPSAFNGIQRRLGFIDAMEAAGMDIITEQAGNWEMAKANQVAAGIVTEHPEVKALLCANDSMALGAAAALRDTGKSDDVYVIGYDGISAARGLIESGDMLCTIEQYPDQLAVYGLKYALEMLKTGGPLEDRETVVDLVTAETLDGAAM